MALKLVDSPKTNFVTLIIYIKSNFHSINLKVSHIHKSTFSYLLNFFQVETVQNWW